MSLSKSGIDYLSHVWNVAVGCERGCSYCWARGLAKRIGKNIGCELCVQFKPHVHPERLRIPGGKPKVIGVGFMTDLFGPKEWLYPDCIPMQRRHLAAYIATDASLRPQHRFVIPTRCPENIPPEIEWPENVTFLITCTSQPEVDERIPRALANIQGGHVVANLEPLVSAVHAARLLYECTGRRVDGVIVGAMSGRVAVPMHPDWVRSIRDECVNKGVPFYFKQWGARAPHEGPKINWPEPDIAWGDCQDWDYDGPRNRMATVPLLDGKVWRELPEAMRLASGVSSR